MMLWRERAWEGKVNAGEGWGCWEREPVLYKTKSRLQWLDSASPPRASRALGTGKGQQGWLMAQRDTELPRGFFGCSDLGAHRVSLSPMSTSCWVMVQSYPKSCWNNPQEHGIFVAKNLNPPEAELALTCAGHRTNPRHGTRASIAQRLLAQPWTHSGAKHVPVLGHWDAPSVFAPPNPPTKKMQSGWECCKPDHCALDYSPRRD